MPDAMDDGVAARGEFQAEGFNNVVRSPRPRMGPPRGARSATDDGFQVREPKVSWRGLLDSVSLLAASMRAVLIMF